MKTDHEILKSLFVHCMRDMSDTDEPWDSELPEISLLCRLIDTAEETGYISVYPDRSREREEEQA